MTWTPIPTKSAADKTISFDNWNLHLKGNLDHAAAHMSDTALHGGETESAHYSYVGNSDCTTTSITLPGAGCSKLLWVSINGLLKPGASRASATQINFNETRVANDTVWVHYVAN